MGDLNKKTTTAAGSQDARIELAASGGLKYKTVASYKLSAYGDDEVVLMLNCLIG